MGDSVELLPCPFCGEMAIYELIHDEVEYTRMCSNCGVKTSRRDTSEEVIQLWNTRTTLKTQADLLRKSESATHKETARIIACCITMLQEGMDSTGTGTRHYQEMSKVVELLTPLTENTSGNPAKDGQYSDSTKLSEVNKLKQETI